MEKRIQEPQAWRQSLLSIGCGLLSCAVLIGLWEGIGSNPENPITQVLPPPSQFLPVLFESDFKIGLGSQAASIYQSVAVTLIRVLLGMTIAFIGSILCGLLISLSKWSELFILPILGLIAPIAGLRDGLGTVVMTGRNLFNSNLILLGICILGITGFAVDRLLLVIQRKFFWWQV